MPRLSEQSFFFSFAALLLLSAVLSSSASALTVPADSVAILVGQTVKLNSNTDYVNVGGMTVNEASEKTGLSALKLSKESKKLGGDGTSFSPGSFVKGSRSIVGPPSLSVPQIRGVLAHYRSPALGSEQCFYDLSVKYNIDVAYLLGFFRQESSYGKATGYSVTHAIGNIQKTAPGSQFCSPPVRVGSRFCGYDSWCKGAEHWFYYMRNSPYYLPKGKVTPDEITPIYAPSSDGNDPQGYASQVNQCVNLWRDGKYC